LELLFLTFQKIEAAEPTFIEQRLNTESVECGDRLVVVADFAKAFPIAVS
jgi:hypothetical protein